MRIVNGHVKTSENYEWPLSLFGCFEKCIKQKVVACIEIDGQDYEARATMNQTEPGIGWFLNHLLSFWAHMKGLPLLFNLVYGYLLSYKK